MRIIFAGVLEQARQLLGDFEPRFGLGQPFNDFLANLAADLPEVSSVDFSGDVALPEGIWARAEGQLDFADYLRPTLRIRRLDDGEISLTVEQVEVGTADVLLRILKTVVAEELGLGNLRQHRDGLVITGGQRVLPKTAVFRTQPNFRHNTFRAYKPGRGWYQKEVEAEITLTHGKSTAGVTLRLTEYTFRGPAYRLGMKMAKAHPDWDVLVYSRQDDEGWEMLHHGYVFEGDEARPVTDEERAAEARQEAAIAPYQKLLEPYLRLRNMAKRCIFANHLDAALRLLVRKGVTNTLLATHLAAAVAQETSHEFSAAIMAFAFGDDEREEKRGILAEARQHLSEVMALRIGWDELKQPPEFPTSRPIRKPGWLEAVLLAPTIPTAKAELTMEDLTALLLTMFQLIPEERWDEVRSMHDEFVRERIAPNPA